MNKFPRKFYVKWQDTTDPSFDPETAVWVHISMPQEIADIERPVIEKIKTLIKEYNKTHGLEEKE